MDAMTPYEILDKAVEKANKWLAYVTLGAWALLHVAAYFYEDNWRELVLIAWAIPVIVWAVPFATIGYFKDELYKKHYR